MLEKNEGLREALLKAIDVGLVLGVTQETVGQRRVGEGATSADDVVGQLEVAERRVKQLEAAIRKHRREVFRPEGDRLGLSNVDKGLYHALGDSDD